MVRFDCLDLGNVSPHYAFSAYHFFRNKELSKPILVHYPYTKNVLCGGNNLPYSSVIDLNKIPESFDIGRIKFNSNKFGTWLIEKDSVIAFFLIAPTKLCDGQSIIKKVYTSMISVLRKKGAPAYKKGNDICLDIDGVEKKAGGGAFETTDKNFVAYMGFTLSMNYNLLDKIFNFGEKSSKDVLIGLSEVIDTNFSLIEEMKENLGFEFDSYSLTENEKIAIENISTKTKKDSWILDGNDSDLDVQL